MDIRGGGGSIQEKIERLNTKFSNKIQQNFRYLNFKIPVSVYILLKFAVGVVQTDDWNEKGLLGTRVQIPFEEKCFSLNYPLVFHIYFFYTKDNSDLNKCN